MPFPFTCERDLLSASFNIRLQLTILCGRLWFPLESVTPLTKFIRPGLRERLVFAPHRYCSEKFTSLFWTCFRFTWGHEFRDAYVKNCQTGLYQFSVPFLEHILDLKYFCMTPKFLDEFPELKEDIPSTTSRSESFQLDSGLNYDFGRIGDEFGMTYFPRGMPATDFYQQDSTFPLVDWSANRNSAVTGSET